MGVVAEVMNMGQHDHHCIVTFMGSNWRIWRVRRHLVDVERPVGYGHCSVFCTIDMADVDFNSYCTKAAAWDNARERA